MSARDEPLFNPTPADALSAAKAAACPQCGTELAPLLLSCPVCHRLVHADQLKRLADEAEQAARANDLAKALAAWREALALLPPGSRQAQIISPKVVALSKQVGEKPEAEASDEALAKSRLPAWASRGGPIVALVLLLWKFKFVVAFVLTKGKLLLLGLANTSTLFSMLLSMGVYWAVWGWKFALGIILSIYIHEMGHVAALNRYGIKASAPMFIPGFGAMVRMKHHPASVMEDARVGLAGPLWGLGAALAAYVVYVATGSPYWAAIARFGAWINLFNLLPLWPLDGGRGFRALSQGQRWALVAVLGALWLVTRDGLLVLLGIVGVVRLFGPAEASQSDRIAFAQYALLAVVLSALSQIPVATP